MFDLNIHKSVSRNDLLVSEPFLQDPNFGRTVILLCEHQNDKGSFGLILNRPTETTLSEALDWPGGDFPLFSGGPVEQSSLYFIHSLPEVSHSLPLGEGLYLGGEFDTLREMAAIGKLSTENCRFFAGYSGWGENQLEQEIEHDSWIISKVKLREVLHMSPQSMWRDVLRRMGGRYRIFSHYPEDPQSN